MATTPAPHTLTIRRRAQVRDDAGNSFGIIEVSPDPAEPAILLGVRMAGSEEPVGLVMRADARLRHEGLELRVVEIETDEPAWVRVEVSEAAS